ncbi:MAG: MCE family protein [Gammaproteobacteria bacterium]|nr:MCE family protein [Gammaproteobacteria bacterium]MCP4091483.1 MCE family protein [Gammaproteobacteria bacterium]MCP4275393.1 MCE family protein [Gammaproteobacteria bacterium]MCP4832281.1 MCE family protein [Gammaproteobacteria bacterium]MCP4928144.1 MCE family protein [Gammaproteobacteria bacterium]
MTDIANAEKKTARESGFSPVWIIPIVALLIGLFLIFRLVTESGPTIVIHFAEGTGIEAGKTKVKFKDVEIGSVTNIDIRKDLLGVDVTVAMNRAAAEYMTEKTSFWVVRPRISGGGVSGLSTLLSGAYIGVDLVAKGERKKSFTGLKRPPVIQSTELGTMYKLHSEHLGRLNFGTPVFYKQIQVGSVVDYKLDDDGQIGLEVFITKPYDKYVNRATRFWNASGIDVLLSADGIEINTESLVTIIGGGIAFDTFGDMGQDASETVSGDHEFRLYSSETASRHKKYRERKRYVLYFDNPVRGLLEGAPVELRGYKIGEVVDISFEFDTDSDEFRIPVLIEIEPERIKVVGSEPLIEGISNTETLVSKGLRAQLKIGNLVLGRLIVAFDFYPDAPAAKLDYSGGYLELPTMQNTISVITEDARVLIAELRETGKTFNDILNSTEFRSSLTNLSDTLVNIQGISVQLDEETTPEVAKALAEVTEAARSFRILVDYLEQHPEAIIKGKE